MRKALLIACALLLWASDGWAQAFIRYYPPSGIAGLTSDGTTITSTVPIVVPDGTATAPVLAFASSTNSGFHLTGGVPSISRSGAQLVGFGATVGFSVGINPNASDAFNNGSSANNWQNVYVSRSIQGAKSKALTDAAAATAFMTVAVPTNGWVGGELIWTATSVSGADQLTKQGAIRFAGATNNVTPVCTVNVIGTDLAATSGGANTLVCTWTNVVASQTCALSVTCTNDLAGTQAITLWGRPDMPIIATLVFP